MSATEDACLRLLAKGLTVEQAIDRSKRDRDLFAERGQHDLANCADRRIAWLTARAPQPEAR